MGSVDFLEKSTNVPGHIYTEPCTGEMVFAYATVNGPFKVLFIYSEKSIVNLKDVKIVQQNYTHRSIGNGKGLWNGFKAISKSLLFD